MQSRYTVDEIAELLARCIADEITSQAVCNSLVSVTQTANIDCSEDDLTALRNSDACIEAVLANDPNQTRICNSCYIVDSSQTAVVDLQMQCGSNAFTQVRGSFVDKLKTFKPREKLNGMTLSAVNQIVTSVTDSTIIPTVKQGVLINQNLSNLASGSNQITIVETVMRAFIDMPGLYDKIVDLERLLNDFGIATTPTTPASLPPVDTVTTTNTVVNNPKPPVTPPPKDDKSGMNTSYIIIILLLVTIFVVIYMKRKKTVDNSTAIDGIEATTIYSV